VIRRLGDALGEEGDVGGGQESVERVSESSELVDGLAATNNAVTSVGMAIFELVGGKITATSLQTDRLGFLQALGVIPYDPAFGPSPSAGASSPAR
jgi:hypothetical protein